MSHHRCCSDRWGTVHWGLSRYMSCTTRHLGHTQHSYHRSCHCLCHEWQRWPQYSVLSYVDSFLYNCLWQPARESESVHWCVCVCACPWVCALCACHAMHALYNIKWPLIQTLLETYYIHMYCVYNYYLSLNSYIAVYIIYVGGALPHIHNYIL